RDRGPARCRAAWQSQIIKPEGRDGGPDPGGGTGGDGPGPCSPWLGGCESTLSIPVRTAARLIWINPIGTASADAAGVDTGTGNNGCGYVRAGFIPRHMIMWAR